MNKQGEYKKIPYAIKSCPAFHAYTTLAYLQFKFPPFETLEFSLPLEGCEYIVPVNLRNNFKVEKLNAIRSRII